uniref:Uncharacterized protein n=1 Tax=Anguilla anguilla TaxID=7936 RepID=A0A0E9SL55_ANGAN
MKITFKAMNKLLTRSYRAYGHTERDITSTVPYSEESSQIGNGPKNKPSEIFSSLTQKQPEQNHFHSVTEETVMVGS